MNIATLNRTGAKGYPCAAGLLQPGMIVRTVGGWDRVTSVELAPDHAAVVIVKTESDPKHRRFHCDDAVRIFTGVR